MKNTPQQSTNSCHDSHTNLHVRCHLAGLKLLKEAPLPTHCVIVFARQFNELTPIGHSWYDPNCTFNMML